MNKAGCFGVLLVALGVAPVVYAYPSVQPVPPPPAIQPAPPVIQPAPAIQPAPPAPPPPRPAPAAPAQTIEAREVKARELFAAGRYAESLDVYVKLYGESPHPTYIRNIGRCYQNMGEPEKSIASFREYLRQVRDLPADQRALVDDYIAEMEAELRRRREEKAAQAAIAGPAGTAPASGAPGASLAPDATVSTGSASADGRRPTRSRRVAALVVGGASLAALVAGGVFGAQAVAKNRDADRACPMDQCTPAGVQFGDEALRAARVADVAIGVGLVGAGIATYLFITSRERPAAAGTSVARRAPLEPQLGPGLMGLTLGGRW